MLTNIKLLVGLACLGFVSAGTLREADLGEPLTQEDFDYVDSEEYKLKINNEEEHDEDLSDSLFEGDIQLSEEERQVLEERGIPGLREVTGRWKWPKSADGLVRVPYKIPSGLSKERRGDIAKTVKEFKDKTCIRLVPYKGEKTGYVYLDTSAGGCSSPLGKKSRYNHIEFGSGCSWGNLCHEFMHTLGFYHEHTRTDRDKYVSVKWGNIPQDWKHNFYKCDQRGQKCNDLTVGYDYGSIMHYGKYLQGKEAIVPKKRARIGQRYMMSPKDVQGIKEYYGCEKRGTFEW